MFRCHPGPARPPDLRRRRSGHLPGQKKWRRLCRDDDRSRALALFIPRLRYWYVREKSKTRKKGLIVYIRMDDPLTPQDAVREQKIQKLIIQGEMEQGAMPLTVRDGKIELLQESSADDVAAITSAIHNIQPDLSSTALRTHLRPIVDQVVHLFDDVKSRRMYYKVLRTLYKQDRLDLFLLAISTSVEVGTDDSDANLGAVFVSRNPGSSGRLVSLRSWKPRILAS